ncbi:hypothetical protein NDU88_005885 [Pleurodeles waltl]|uniref:Uncharacterized protein n=1 Tax=Pleurodeles waltl TaxID=8319 RepID=A0AAV7WVY7_PLEWA|nr:hypothetical protein NDU88_005885 [Pleurodeles waltl]
MSEGSLGMPNIQQYYHALQLRFQVEWSKEELEKHWLLMDRVAAGTSLWKLPFLQRAMRPKSLYASSISRSTMEIWDRVSEMAALTSFPTPLTPIIGNANFTPGLNYAASGPLSTFDDSGPMIFAQMHADHELPKMVRLLYF